MANREVFELLQMHRSTRGLDRRQIEMIASKADVVRTTSGQVLCEQDEPIESIYLVISGHLSLALPVPGGEMKAVLHFGRDDQVGLLSVIQEEPIPARLVSDHRSILVRVTRRDLEPLMRRLPVWSRNLLKGMGPKLRDVFVGKRLQHRPRVVGFVHNSAATRPIASMLLDRLANLGESIGVIGDDQATLDLAPGESASIVSSPGVVRSVSEIRSQFGAWPRANRLVIDCNIETVQAELGAVLAACDVVYWFCSSDDAERFIDFGRAAEIANSDLQQKVCVIHTLRRDQQVAPLTPGLHELCFHEFKLHWDGCDAVDSQVITRAAGVERILHHLRGVTIGLALGGGAARGMAHLGVLNVLEQAGITVDRLSGTSAGALTGIVYAAGYGPDFMIGSFVRDLTPGWLYRMLPYGDAIYLLYKFRTGGWDRMLRKYLFDWRLEQLPLPFSSVAVDLVAAEPVIRREGDAISALLESINLPGVARPICRDGKALVDGGVLDVVPADVLVNQESNLVIASDVASRIRFEFAGNRSDMTTEQMKVPSGTAALVRTRTVQDRNIRSIGESGADVVIEPDVSEVELTDFKNAAKIAQSGTEAAEAAIPTIREILREMDPELFPSTG